MLKAEPSLVKLLTENDEPRLNISRMDMLEAKWTMP
jgi:hypothetical protein